MDSAQNVFKMLYCCFLGVSKEPFLLFFAGLPDAVANLSSLENLNLFNNELEVFYCVIIWVKYIPLLK